MDQVGQALSDLAEESENWESLGKWESLGREVLNNSSSSG
jgi:hypothetical protein